MARAARSHPGATNTQGLARQLDDAAHRLAELEALLDARSRLEEMGQLAAGLAHEFANLLVPLTAAARALADRHGGSPDLDRLTAGLGACSDLTAAVMRLSQGMPARASVFEAGKIVREAISFASALDRRGEVRLSPIPDCLGYACASSVRQAVANAIVRAARISGGLDEVTVDVRCSTWNDLREAEGISWGALPDGGGDGHAVEVRVIGATGAGPADEPGRVFDASWAGGGAAVGLAMARLLMAGSGGGIGASSAADGGLRVHIAFNRAPSP